MSQIAGKYELVHNENFLEYLRAFGVPEQQAEQVNLLRPTLEIQIDGNKVSLISNSGLNNASSTLILDEEVDEPLPIAIKLKSIAKLDGNTLTIHSKSDAGDVGTRTYKVSGDELVLIMTGENENVPEARRIYRRIL